MAVKVMWFGFNTEKLTWIFIFLECNQIISEVPFTQLEASSHKKGKKRHVCSVADGHIHSSGGWCPKRSNGEETVHFLFLIFGVC